MTIKRIFGHDVRVSKFFLNCHEVLKKIKPKINDKYCLEVCYKATNVTKQEIPTSIIASLIDHFIKLGGLGLLLEVILTKAYNNV